MPPTNRDDKYINKKEALQKAVEVAKKADVAIVYVGTTTAVESEGHDRTQLGLPGDQEELVKKVFAANPNTVVVLMNAGPLTIPWIKNNARAIIGAWWGGEEGGDAIADVIFGNINPGGKLPYTVYASESQVPPQDEYDVSKGFTYMYIKGKPLFPFGYGLSYTDFKYSDLKISPKNIRPSDSVIIKIAIENTGKVTGDEVVQLYIHDVKSSVKTLVKELRGFKRITLNPGEKKDVVFSLQGKELAFYDEKTHGFIVEPGAFDVLIGSSSEDIRLKTQFNVINSK